MTETPDTDPFEVKWTKKNEPKATDTSPTMDGDATVVEDVATLKRQLEEERQRANDLRDRWQRSAADLANLRKRVEQEKEEMEKFAGMLLIQELLPVLDNFERALTTIPNNLRMLTWIYGVALIERELQAVLERRGLQPIDVKGQHFNPHFHEAISERETDEAEVGTVLQEYQKGYTMHGVVIRPALVEVAKAPSAPAAEQPLSTEPEAESTEQTKAASENVGP